MRSCVAGCVGDGGGVWGRRELGSGAPATSSGLRRGCCVAGGGTSYGVSLLRAGGLSFVWAIRPVLLALGAGAVLLAVASETRERSGAAWCGFGRRDAVGGRRDALGGSGVSLALLACSQPRIAQECAVRARRGRVSGMVRAG